MLKCWKLTLFLVAGLCWRGAAEADWPMLRGNPQHTGFVEANLKAPYHLAWVREIEGERLGTAMEPIIAQGKLFVATHAGNLYALKAESGDSIWRFQTEGAFLQSPAVVEGIVVAASTDGNLYGLDCDNGKLLWWLPADHGGFSAAPILADGAIYIGTRRGHFLAVSSKNGKELWSASLEVPIRQTAAFDRGYLYITAEDLRVRCFRAEDGKLVWTSAQLTGQTARDYYPVVLRHGPRAFVIVRTNPLLNMGQRISRDRSLLSRNAGVDDSNWQKVDAWIKSDQARGTPQLWAKEQAAIVQCLQSNRVARSFFVLDATSGQETFIAPVLWIGGCQGIGVEPAQAADGRLLVFYRSAYGNWNQGVAPLVALGLLDLTNDHITPLFHNQGRQPPWNCFWGTADESQNFLVVGQTALMIHQGTLSGFDLKENRLFPICGERDTYGGFRNPRWARNEWHGPARGSVAVVANRIYWQTGSRVLCIVAGEPGNAGNPPKPSSVEKDVATIRDHGSAVWPREDIIRELNATTVSILAQKWAPLFTDPGLSGRVFSFADSSDLFEAFAWAYPHLSAELQSKAVSLLRAEWTNHPPFSSETQYSLKDGARREYFWVPTDLCSRLGQDKQRHPFGNMDVVWLFAQRCQQEALVLENWPQLKAVFEDFKKLHWRLDPTRGDPFANSYLASLLAFHWIAERAGDQAAAREAQAQADEIAAALVQWWKHAAEEGTLKTFNTSSELDPFINKGDALFLAIAPHRHVLALFQDLNPEVAALVHDRVPTDVERVWRTFSELCPTWYLTAEERQVHFGENFVDPPGFALNCFKALAWLKAGSAEQLSHRVDLPFCRADLYYLTKLAITLEAR